MHLFLWAEDAEAELRSEVAQGFAGAPLRAHDSWLETDFRVAPGKRLPHLAFARQWLPLARPLQADSIRAWANQLFEALVGVVPEAGPWALHLEPQYGTRAVQRIGARAWHTATHLRNARQTTPGREEPAGPASEPGRHRCQLIRHALLELLQKKRRHLLRRLRAEPAPFTPEDSLAQLLLTTPDTGFISVAAAPLPFEQRHLLSPFPKGEVPLASDQAAPSRAFAKLVEAELRLGRAIRANETCADLGASPGSWTYTAVRRGARVVAVDRSPLREDLMAHPRVQFVRGDAFRFKPAPPVDWLLCDVIAAPERTAELLLEWLRRGWCRHFVVTLKWKDAPGTDVLSLLKQELPPLTREFFLSRLCANKKELCAFGDAKGIHTS